MLLVSGCNFRKRKVLWGRLDFQRIDQTSTKTGSYEYKFDSEVRVGEENTRDSNFFNLHVYDSRRVSPLVGY